MSAICRQLGDRHQAICSLSSNSVAGQPYGDSPAMNPILPDFGKFSQDLTKFKQVSASTFEAIEGGV